VKNLEVFWLISFCRIIFEKRFGYFWMSIGWSIFNADFYVAIPLKCFCICFLFFRKKNNENQAWEPF